MCGQSKTSSTQGTTTTATGLKVGDKVRILTSFYYAKDAQAGTVSKIVGPVKDHGAHVSVPSAIGGSLFFHNERLELVVEPQAVEQPKAPEGITKATATATENGVTLNLTRTEAEVLQTILGVTGGSPKNSPRKYAQRIYEALLGIGIDYDLEHYRLSPGTSTLHFKDYPPKKAKEVTQQSVQEAPVEAPKFKVGDRVKVLRDRTEITAGEIALVTSVDGAGALLAGCDLETSDGRKGWDLFENLELVTEGITKAPEPAPRTIQKGDKVWLTVPVASFRQGESAKVTGTGCGTFLIESTGCGPTRAAWALKKDLKLAA